MLRSSSAKHLCLASQVASTSYSTLTGQGITRSISKWQQGQTGPASSYEKGKQRHLSTLDLSEKKTLAEIRELKSKLALLDKRKEAEVAGELAGELDEETLDRVYQAINTAEPMSEEDLRLEEKRKRWLLNNSMKDQESMTVITEYMGQVIQRLTALEERVRGMHPITSLEDASGVEDDSYARISTLLKKKGVPLEPTEGFEKTVSSKAEKDIVEGNGGTSGLQVFFDATARESLLTRIVQLTDLIKGQSQITRSEETIPLGIATKQEWEALAIAFATANEEGNVRKTIDAAEQSGHGSLVGDLMNKVLDVYAEKGDVERCQLVRSWMTEQDIAPNDYTRHCLVKSYILAGQLEKVFDILGSMENSTPASIPTYTLAIEHLLLQQSSPKLQSSAWTLFNRMRLVAHPIPDATLYALMIKACAMAIPQSNSFLWKPSSPNAPRNTKLSSKGIPDSERALDLFREMTSRYKIRPTREVFTSLISACTRRKDMYEKGFEIFRKMIDMERSRQSSQDEESTSFAPDRSTYNALLQGCARTGDLLRARWILAEMLRSATLKWQEMLKREKKGKKLQAWQLQEIEYMRPDAKTLTNVFFAYATHKGQHQKRSSIQAKASGSGELDNTIEGEKREILEQENRLKETEEATEFIDEDTLTYRLPVSSTAIFREATALMERVKEDYKQQGGLLSSVQPEAHFINSYIAVISAHCNERERVQEMQRVLFGSKEDKTRSLVDHFDVTINSYTFEAVIDACSKIAGRQEAVDLAEALWNLWIEQTRGLNLDQTSMRKAIKIGFNSRTISKCWSGMIRVYAKSNQLDQAMTLVREFARLYPPSAAAAKPEESTATPGSLSRLDPKPTRHASSSIISAILGNQSSTSLSHHSSEDDITTTLRDSPYLEFKAIEILHLRLVEAENRIKDIRYLTWLVRMYTKSRRPKMPESLRGVSMVGRQAAIGKLVQQRGLSAPSSSMHFRR